MAEKKYRIVSGYDGHRLTWHSLECATGLNAKYARTTALDPDERRAKIAAKRGGRDPYYTDHMARCCLGRRSDADRGPTFTATQARQLFDKARTAGLQAGNDAVPTPMTVGQATSLFSNDIDHSKPTHYVPEGVCGFAWVTIRPGNSSIARHAKKLAGGSTAYGGGVSIWISDHAQSMERKERHARAYADVLRKNGINATSDSRLD